MKTNQDLKKHRISTHAKKKSKAKVAQEARDMRENLSEKDIDKTSKDSFPASDPPA